MKYSPELSGLEKRKFSQADRYWMVDFNKDEIIPLDKNEVRIEHDELKVKGKILIDAEIHTDESDARKALFRNQLITKLELIVEKEKSTIETCRANIREATSLIMKLMGSKEVFQDEDQ